MVAARTACHQEISSPASKQEMDINQVFMKSAHEIEVIQELRINEILFRDCLLSENPIQRSHQGLSGYVVAPPGSPPKRRVDCIL